MWNEIVNAKAKIFGDDDDNFNYVYDVKKIM